MEDFSDIKTAVLSFGANDCALARVDDGPARFPYALSIVVRLSDAIIDEIENSPTYTYFNHYRSVNVLLDQVLLRTGLWLQERDAQFITIAASQSRPDSPLEGRYSHKKAACLAGLGRMGRNCLFLHHKWGPRVRLATLFTDWKACENFLPSEAGSSASKISGLPDTHILPAISAVPLLSLCESCLRCVSACPAHAFDNGTFDSALCSAWMKKAYQHIGRGAVCGICIKVCPGK